MIEPRKLGQILVDLKVLRRSDIERVLEASRRRPRPRKFGQLAKDMGLVHEEDILAALAVQMKLLSGITRMNLRQILAILQRA